MRGCDVWSDFIMNNLKLRRLFELSEKMAACDDADVDLNVLLEQCASDFSDDAQSQDDVLAARIFDNMKRTARELAALRRARSEIGDKMSGLSDEDREACNEVNRLLDNNLFDYYYQPIVSAVDGHICSFEALMRPNSDICKSPLSVIKYADLMGRLPDIEKATFCNVLSSMKDHRFNLDNRCVFINSIPSVKLPQSDLDPIKTAMSEQSDHIVVEMTEQTEVNDDDLSVTKDFYRHMGIKTAIDDYGTGYSNIQNLIRYSPDYVKIDRMLITNVHNDPQKQHFVREIVDFCHRNNIVALAEGVETFDEMRTVIMFGVDLIQGYYTAKPSSEIITSIPHEIRQEIKQCHHDYSRSQRQFIHRAACRRSEL